MNMESTSDIDSGLSLAYMKHPECTLVCATNNLFGVFMHDIQLFADTWLYIMVHHSKNNVNCAGYIDINAEDNIIRQMLAVMRYTVNVPTG